MTASREPWRMKARELACILMQGKFCIGINSGLQPGSRVSYICAVPVLKGLVYMLIIICITVCNSDITTIYDTSKRCDITEYQ